MIVHGNGKDFLRFFLTDNIFIKICLDVRRLGQVFKMKPVALGIMYRELCIVGDYAHAKIDALITYICSVSGNESAGLSLRFSAK